MPRPVHFARPWLLVALLGLCHLAWSATAVVPGYLSIDEGTYHYMVKSLADGHGFTIWNGFEELPSAELVAGTFSVEEGRLVAVPPELFTVMALPFYVLLGYRGLFLLNALAFLATIALTWDLARRLASARVAVTAALVLGLATYSWDYSQAAWPHAVATLFVVAAAWASVRAFLATNAAEAGRWALTAGLIAGLAPGIRLDAAFAWPAVFLPFLFDRPPRWREAALALAGLIPGLTLLTLINRHKFGAWTPFTYGREGTGANTGLLPYLPIVAAGAALLAALWLASRPRGAEALRRRPLVTAGAVALGLALILLLPPLRDAAWRLAHGAWQLVVDLRVRDPGIREPALARTATGGMVYVGSLKKSLLQSCPYLPILVLPLAAALRGRRRVAVLLLLPVPAAFLAAFSYFAWHGGLSLNLRYLVPILPFTSILAALALDELFAGPGRGARWAAIAPIAVVAAAGAALVAAGVFEAPPQQQEPAVLDAPLALAVAALLAGGAIAAVGGRSGRLLRGAAGAVTIAGMAWAAVATFAYDAPRARQVRSFNLAVARQVAPHVTADSILFASYPDPYFALIEIDRLRLAITGRDGFADFRRLTDFHLAEGRPVYASLRPDTWRSLAQEGLLDGLAGEPLRPDGLVVRLRHAPR